MTLLLKLRNALKDCTNGAYQHTLRIAADALDFELQCFTENPTEGNMIALNGAWSHAARVLKNLPAEGDPAPISGAPQPTQFTTPQRQAA